MSEQTLLTVAQLGLWLVACAALIGLGAFVVGRFRGGADQEQATPRELLSNFREVHARGELSDEEFRTIKTLLVERSHQELKDTGETG